MVLVDFTLMKDSIIWSSDSKLFSSNDYSYDLKKSSQYLNSIVHRQTVTPSYFNFWDFQTLEHSHEKLLSPHCSMESTASTWDFQPTISPEPLKDSLDADDYYHQPDACLSSSLCLTRLKSDMSDMLVETYVTQNRSKEQPPHTASLSNASIFEAGPCDSPVSNIPCFVSSTVSNCVQHPSTSFSFSDQSKENLKDGENGIICRTSFDSYIPQDNSCDTASSVNNSSLLDDIRHPCATSNENFSSEKMLFPSKNILNYDIQETLTQEQNNENNFDILVTDTLSQHKRSTLDTTSYASDPLFLDTQTTFVPIDYSTYYDPSSTSHPFHKIQHKTDLSGSYKTAKDDLLYNDEATLYLPSTENSLQTPPLSTCSGPPSQDEKTEQMLAIDINSGSNVSYDPHGIGNLNESHVFDTFFPNENKNNTLPSDACSNSLSWQQSQQNQNVESYALNFHSSDESKQVNPSERPSDAPVPCMYRLSRSPTARAAIVQYPYPPVPPHCLPPLKHTQQQALFNEYLKIERDALRVQLGHFIVEYCTRSIPDKYFRSERTPDPRIIKDFVDQVIFAVEIFGEQAQYVHAHNAIPTDINEVYISTWLQQKKEFLKPLEMLYVKREREKLLARQNTFAQMSPNTLSCFLQSQPRKSLCTPKTTRIARQNSSLHSTDSDSIAQTTATTKATTPSPRQRRSRDTQSTSRASNSTTSGRGNLSLGEELDDLGVPRTIHFENLRSAIEHRGIVVQLPSNNTSGSVPSCKRLNSSRRNVPDSSFQYGSLFNLLISGRGDTRRSRLQLPWGDTVNIKYNRTLLGIPDFLVEGLGYSHLGSNHHLIPKVCAVSLEGSLYGVEVLLFYRGLPCTKRIAKRYVVQPYDSKPSNFFRMYTKPQELQPPNRCTPSSIQSTEHPILHSELYTTQSRDVCFDTSCGNIQASPYAQANRSFDESANKTEKQYRTLDPLLHKHKRLRQEEVNHPLSISTLTNLNGHSISEIDPNNTTTHHVSELPYSVQEDKYYINGQINSSCEPKLDFQWDETTNLDFATRDTNCNVYYPNQYLESFSNSNQTPEPVTLLQWNPSLLSPSNLQTACENTEWKNSDVGDTSSSNLSLVTKIETTTPSQHHFTSFSSESPKEQFDNNVPSLSIENNELLHADEKHCESASSKIPYVQKNLMETSSTAVPLLDSTAECSHRKLTLDSTFDVQKNTVFPSSETANAISFPQDNTLDIIYLQRQIFSKLNEPSTMINQASEGYDNNTCQNSSNCSESIEKYITHSQKNFLNTAQEQWRRTTPLVDSETTLNAINETATEETATSVQRTRLMVSCSTSDKHAGGYKTHTSLANGRYRRKCIRKLKGTTFNIENPTLFQDTVTVNGPSTHKDPQFSPEATMYNYIQIPNYVNLTANTGLPYTAHVDDYYASMYPSLYLHES